MGVWLVVREIVGVSNVGPPVAVAIGCGLQPATRITATRIKYKVRGENDCINIGDNGFS
jgi:hypothetical protein